MFEIDYEYFRYHKSKLYAIINSFNYKVIFWDHWCKFWSNFFINIQNKFLGGLSSYILVRNVVGSSGIATIFATLDGCKIYHPPLPIVSL